MHTNTITENTDLLLQAQKGFILKNKHHQNSEIPKKEPQIMLSSRLFLTVEQPLSNRLIEVPSNVNYSAFVLTVHCEGRL